MGFNKFKTDQLKRPRRRKRSEATGTGDTTGMIHVKLDAKTTVFCKTKADVAVAKRKWAEKQKADIRSLHTVNPNAPSVSREYKRNYAKEKAEQSREKSIRKKDMGPF